jgi:hypothetical protein
MIIAAIAYIITRMYMNAKADETVVHEWIDFPELETMHENKTAREDKHTTLHVGFIFNKILLEIPSPFRHLVKLSSADMMLIVIMILFVIRLLFVLITIILLFNYQQELKKKKREIKKLILWDIENIYSTVNTNSYEKNDITNFSFRG